MVATRGGLYAGTPRDTSLAYLRHFLGFLGLTDVEFVYAEGLAIGAEQQGARRCTMRSRRSAVSRADSWLESLIRTAAMNEFEEKS